jgi:pyridoxamine 5'-phosphate oxidase
MSATAPLFAPIAAPPESLPPTPEVLVAELWRRIADALNGRWPPWALPTLATASADGPKARVLALRSIDPAERLFVFHTDARSDKIRELRSDARVSVVFWDPVDAIEARFTGLAIAHCGDDVARNAWQRVSPLRRMASAIELAPNAPLAQPGRFDALPSTDSYEQAMQRFAVIEVRASGLDWLWLGPADMRRASIRWTEQGMSATWVAP